MLTIQELVGMKKRELAKHMFDQKYKNQPKSPWNAAEGINFILTQQADPRRIEVPHKMKLETALELGLVKFGGEPFSIDGEQKPAAKAAPVAQENSIKGNASELIKRIIERGATTEIKFSQSKTETKPVKIHVGRSNIRYARGEWLPIEDKFLEALSRTSYPKAIHSLDAEGRKVVKNIQIDRYVYHTRTLQA